MSKQQLREEKKTASYNKCNNKKIEPNGES